MGDNTETEAENIQETETDAPEVQKTSIHIMLNKELLGDVRKLADYAAAAGLIQDDPRGNVTDFINWCIMVGRDQLRLYVLQRRKFI